LSRFEKSVDIKAPAEKVWEMLALDRMPEWMDVAEVQSAKYISEVRIPDDKYKVGATAHVIEKRWEYDLEIIESLKNEKMTTQTKGGKHGMGYTATTSLKPIQDGTKLTLVLDIEPGYGLLGKVMYGLLRSAEEKILGRTIEKLKSILEK
jgi:carbon monoxide dehydrogenase subunit G